MDQDVYKRLDAFELRVLACLSTCTDPSSIQTKFDSLRAEHHSILVQPLDETEFAPTLLDYDIVLYTLFSEDIAQTESTRTRGKRHQSSHASKASEYNRAKKRKQKQHEQCRKASIVDEESRMQRVRKSVVRE